MILKDSLFEVGVGKAPAPKGDSWSHHLDW